MNKSAVISGDYVDLKFIQGRKVCRVYVEIPLEYGKKFTDAFGTPDAANPVKVAIARLAETAGPESRASASATPEAAPEGQARAAPTTTKAVRNWRDIPRSQQAALSLQHRDFVEWLLATHPVSNSAPAYSSNPDNDRALKAVLGIASKKELDTDPVKAALWDKLKTSFDLRSYGVK